MKPKCDEPLSKIAFKFKLRRYGMVSSIIHLANKDYPALVDDFIGGGRIYMLLSSIIKHILYNHLLN